MATMGEGVERGPKVTRVRVDVDTAVWRQYRALLVAKGQTVQEGLGGLIDKEVERGRRSRSRGA